MMISPAAQIAFGPFTLVAGERLLLREGLPVELGARAFDILAVLAARPNDIVSKRELMALVWPDVTVDDSNLRFQVGRLRKALGDGKDGARYIATLTGRGYCFVAGVSRLDGQHHAQGDVAGARLFPATVGSQPRKQKAARIFGREDVIESICLLLGESRILTIVGPGGIGKSTVADAVLTRLRHRYRDGGIAIDLAPISNSSLVPTVIASALSYVPRSQDLMAEISDYLQDKQLLILVDSCDHMIDAVAPWAEHLALETPDVTILATSREPLRAQDEHVHRLSALDIPPSDTVQSSREVIRYAAVELFVERARACLGGYEISDEDAPYVSKICARLDGIALAIELAAGRLETIGIKGLAASLDDCFRILTHGRRTALPRHQTLRATLDWSYNILGPDEQLALRELSVFKGYFTTEGIRSVVLTGRSEDEIDDAVVGLVAKSLVSAEPTASTTRYRLLDTTRTYANEKLVASGDHQALSVRHAAYALALFERAESELYSQSAKTWKEDYSLHLPTLRTALDWTFGPDGDALLGAKLTILALPFFFRMSLIDECLGYVTRSIAYLEDNPGLDERNRMKLYAALGWPQMLSTGDNGMAAWTAALEIAESIGDIDHQLRAIWAAWVDRLNNAEPRAALVFAERFRKLAAISTDETDAILSVRLYGATLHWLGRQTEARSAMEEMLEAYVAPPSPHAVRFQFDQRVTAKIILARALWLQGFADQALAEVRATIDYAVGLEHNLSLSNVLAEAACSIAIWTGKSELARAYINLLSERTRANSLDVWHTYAQCFSGVLALSDDRPDECLRLLDAGLPNLQASGFILFQTELLGARSLAHMKLGNTMAALDAVDSAISQCSRTGERWYLAELHRIKGEVLVETHPMDDDGLAMVEFARSLEVAREDQTLAWELRTTTSVSRLWSAQGKVEAARQLLSPIYDRFSEGFETGDLEQAKQLLQVLSERASRAR
jgi:predicted ATPase/DNA-binding winged helix-turn-helix (wHTH) protein